MTKLVLGNGDMVCLKEKNSLVDRSLLIKLILESEKRVQIFSFPSGFGKSTNQSMLEYFFSQQYENNNYFQDSLLFSERNAADFRQHQSKYIVLRLKFHADKDLLYSVMNGIGYSLTDYCNYSIEKIYDSLSLMLKKDHLNAIECSNMLRKLFNQLMAHSYPTIILIDEYDAPFQNDHHKRFEILSAIRELLIPITSHPAIFKVIMTGVLPIAPEELFGFLKRDIDYYSLFDTHVSPFFGLTAAEIETIYDKESSAQIAEHGGYKIGNKQIYSVLQAIVFSDKTQQFQPGNGFINLFLERIYSDVSFLSYLRKQFESLLYKVDPVTLAVKIYPVIAATQLDGNSPDLIWTLLFHAGYIALERKLDASTYVVRISDKQHCSFFNEAQTKIRNLIARKFEEERLRFFPLCPNNNASKPTAFVKDNSLTHAQAHNLHSPLPDDFLTVDTLLRQKQYIDIQVWEELYQWLTEENFELPNSDLYAPLMPYCCKQKTVSSYTTIAVCLYLRKDKDLSESFTANITFNIYHRMLYQKDSYTRISADHLFRSEARIIFAYLLKAARVNAIDFSNSVRYNIHRDNISNTLKALRTIKHPVSEIDLSNCGFDDFDVRNITTLIIDNPDLERVHLWKSAFTKGGIKRITDELINANRPSLTISFGPNHSIKFVEPEQEPASLVPM